MNGIYTLDGRTVGADIINKYSLNSEYDPITFIRWIEDESSTLYYSLPTNKIDDKQWTYTDDNRYPYGLVFTNTWDKNAHMVKGVSCGNDWFNYNKCGINHLYLNEQLI